MGENVVEARDLSAGYPGREVWKGASFSIRKGEFDAIIGPNGSGKTTLFKLLLGLIPPLSGSLTVLGKPPRRGDARIGYVPQRHTIDGDSAIESLEIVRLGACNCRWGFDFPSRAKREREEALDALRSVGAEELAHRPLSVLSGGELQRVFLAQAIVGAPELLLLDEPLANLDLRRESEMVQLVQRVAKERDITVLLVAHNINPLLSVLNRVIYVAAGGVAAGEAGEVLNSASLSKLYNSHVEVLRDSRGRIAIIGADEGAHHHDHE